MSTFRWEPRAVGMAVAAAIGLCLAVIGLAVAADWSAPPALVLPLSLPVGLLLARRHARAVVESPGLPIGRLVVMCLQALVVGALLDGAVGAITGSTTGTETLSSPWEVIVWAAGSAFLGIIVLGIPMLAIIGPVVVLWAVVLRRAVRVSGGGEGAEAWHRAAVWGLVLLAAAVGSNFAWPLLGALGLADVGWFASLLLWFVLAPIAVVMFVVNVARAWQLR